MPVEWLSGSVREFSEQLAKDVRAQEAVLLLGAGVSSVEPSRLPLGRELRDQIVHLMFSESTLLPQYRQLLSDPKFARLLPEIAFSDLFTVVRKKLMLAFRILRGSKPNIIHEAVSYFSQSYSLPVFTTNFDVLIEEAGAVSDLVFHLHGSVNRPDTMAVLLRHVHRRAKPHYSDEFIEFLRSRKLYVLGYSGADPDIMRLVSDAECSAIYWLMRPEPDNFTYNNAAQAERLILACEGTLEALGSGLRESFHEFAPTLHPFLEHRGAGEDLEEFRTAVSAGEQYLALALLFYRINEFGASVQVSRLGLRQRVAVDRKERLQLVIFVAEVSTVRGEPKEKLLPLLEEESRRPANTIYFAQLLNTIGLLYLKEDDYVTARGFFERARETSRSRIAAHLEDEVALARTVLAQTANNIGLCYYGEDQLEAARVWFKRSLDMKRKIGHVLGEVPSMNNLALVALRTGQSKSFRYWDRRGITRAEELGLWRRIVEHLRDTSEIFEEGGDLLEARARLARAIAIGDERLSGMERELESLRHHMEELQRKAG